MFPCHRPCHRLPPQADACAGNVSRATRGWSIANLTNIVDRSAAVTHGSILMSSRIDEAIAAYSGNRTDARLRSLHEAFLKNPLLVPVSEPVKELQPSKYDVPVICMRTESGAGAIPAFTTLDHLFKWKPQGCLYVSITGRALLTMAIDMTEISEILVNPNDSPRGRIPKGDFEQMLAMRLD